LDRRPAGAFTTHTCRKQAGRTGPAGTAACPADRADRAVAETDHQSIYNRPHQFWAPNKTAPKRQAPGRPPEE